ncbi:MAG: PIN domain-containing protein [Deltaproteobacteria bacterium]|nr:PIN domain-containing protein [Deltaproteobacteria bacterium]
MGSKSDLVLIDTNIFVIDLRYKRDVKFNSNRVFLDYIAKKRNGFTTVVNLLELCGILSFNLNEKQLTELWSYFQQKYQVAVLPFPSLDVKFPEVEIREIFDMLKTRTSLGDALMISVAKKHTPFCRTMISWDNLHFETIFQGPVLTPEEFIRSSAEK